MVAPHADAIVGGFLRRLDDELQALPRGRRKEIVAEIEEHISAAREQLHDESDADLLTMLDRIGDPADIASEAHQRFDASARNPGLAELAGILLIGPGNLVMPLVSLLVGATLVWFSPCWRRRDKLIGVYLPLGVWFLPWVLGPLMLDNVSPAFHSAAFIALPLAASGWLAWQVRRRLSATARAMMALVTAAVAVPVIVASMPVRTYAFIGHDGPPGVAPVVRGETTCNGFYGTTEQARGFGGAGVPLNVGICWDGRSVRKIWGPDCSGSYGPFVVVDVRSCTARQQEDGSLIVSSDVRLHASTSPVIGSDRTMTWRITPDGALQQFAP